MHNLAYRCLQAFCDSHFMWGGRGMGKCLLIDRNIGGKLVYPHTGEHLFHDAGD